MDVTNFKKMKSFIDAFYKKQKSIDYLVNTTGVLWFNKDVSAVDIHSDVWDKVFEINLKFDFFGIPRSVADNKHCLFECVLSVIVPTMQKSQEERFDAHAQYQYLQFGVSSFYKQSKSEST